MKKNCVLWRIVYIGTQQLKLLIIQRLYVVTAMKSKIQKAAEQHIFFHSLIVVEKALECRSSCSALHLTDHFMLDAESSIRKNC